MSTAATVVAGDSVPALQEIRGPSALTSDFRRFLVLTRTIAVMEFKLRFFGSVLGYVWQLMRPLMLFGVLVIVFTQVVPLGGDLAHFEVALLLGIVIYTFFAEATGGAVTCVMDRENLVRKIHFPRMVIPLSVVITTFLNFCLNFAAVLVFFVIQGVEIRWSWLELFPMVAVLCAFSTGFAMALSALYVRYRDVQPIWDVALPISFYGTPILYPIEALPSEKVQHLLMCNPLAVVVEQVRHALIDPTAPSAAAAIGGAPRLLIPLAILVAVCVSGYVTFNRSAPRIAEEM